MAIYRNDDMAKVTEFVQKHSRSYDVRSDKYLREPFAVDVKAGKTSSIYNAHSYHTKVPPEGIARFIIHYTEPGDIVLDPFCGSGMTGIAALQQGRNAILLDISPVATFIAGNYCNPINRKEFVEEEEQIQRKIKVLTDWLYETRCEVCGRKSTIEFMVWSEELQCPRCNASFSLWDVSVVDDEQIKKNFKCPNCAKELERSKCRRMGNKPVIVIHNCPSCKRKKHSSMKFDLYRLHEIENRFNTVYSQDYRYLSQSVDGYWPIDENEKPLWYPSDRMPEGDESRRNDRIGITHVNHFYSTRNLWALSELWYQISKVKNERTKQALQFVFTSFNPSLVSLLTRYNFGKRGNDPLSGTLYIPSFSVERNVYSIWENKKKSILGLSSAVPPGVESLVATQSATDLVNIPSDSIDYVFTDPPFGSNLMYSELNFIWESWFDKFTNSKDEAIVNRHQNKGIAEYKDLMTRSFKEIYRALKPGRWMTMIFHNSNGEVWQAIQDGLSNSGFSVAAIGIFDKKQRSFKQVTSNGAVGYDVVINCYKPKATAKNGINGKTTNNAIIGFLADQMLKLPLVQNEDRTPRMLHSKTIGFFMLQNKPLRNLSFDEFQKILRDNFREIDGYWYLPYQRPGTQGQKRLFGCISNEAETIVWLEEFLQTPRKYGDIAPEFFKALGSNKLPRDLQMLLEDNFIEEAGKWRNPTVSEKDVLIRRLTDKTAREINEYLEGNAEHIPTDGQICAWIEFSYNNSLYSEGSQLFRHISESAVSPDAFKKAKRIAEICRFKVTRIKKEISVKITNCKKLKTMAI